MGGGELGCQRTGNSSEECRFPMGNKLTCCLKPSANPKLGRHSRRVEPRCESEVYEAAARDAVAVGTSPASPKPPKWNFGGFKGLHPENIRGPETPEGKKRQMPPALWLPLASAAPSIPWEGATAWAPSCLEPAF